MAPRSLNKPYDSAGNSISDNSADKPFAGQELRVAHWNERKGAAGAEQIWEFKCRVRIDKRGERKPLRYVCG